MLVFQQEFCFFVLLEHLRKCLENSMENMPTDVMVQWVNIIYHGYVLSYLVLILFIVLFSSRDVHNLFLELSNIFSEDSNQQSSRELLMKVSIG